jgi:hypothetical protein
MPFQRGKSGNPAGTRGPKAEKAFAEAVRTVSKRTEGQDKKTMLMKMADQLFKHALVDGEGWAFQMIADRLDGKAVQQTDVNINDTRDSIEQFSDLELAAVLRGKLDEERAKMPATNKAGDTLN